MRSDRTDARFRRDEEDNLPRRWRGRASRRLEEDRDADDGLEPCAPRSRWAGQPDHGGSDFHAVALAVLALSARVSRISDDLDRLEALCGRDAPGGKTPALAVDRANSPDAENERARLAFSQSAAARRMNDAAPPAPSVAIAKRGRVARALAAGASWNVRGPLFAAALVLLGFGFALSQLTAGRAGDAPVAALAGISTGGSPVADRIPADLRITGSVPEKRSSEADSAFRAARQALEGRGMARDPALARRLLDEAARLGHPEAPYRLGRLHEDGEAGAPDLARASTAYRLGADQGDAHSMHRLAVLLAQGAAGAPDHAAAAGWFLKAAEAGVTDAQFNLAVMLAQGLGIARDSGAAYRWFAIAARHGDAEAARKRDEAAMRLSALDLARAQADAQAWRPLGS